MNLASGILDVQPIASAKETILLLDSSHTRPRDEERRMKRAKQKHGIEINAGVRENDANNIPVRGEDAAEPR